MLQDSPSMDSMAGPVEPGFDHADSPNLRVVKDTFEVLGESGLEAAIEHLLKHSHDDVEFAPYVAAGVVLRGADEVRAFYRDQIESGTVLTARPSSIEEDGDEVVVNGSLRVQQPTGGFAESQLSWTYRFRDGRLQEARWGPRRPA
jgi:ketosteroid isomerase-like protein